MHDSRSPWTLTPIGMGLVTFGALVLAMIAAGSSTHDEARVAIRPGQIDASSAGSAAPALRLDPASGAAPRPSASGAVVPMPPDIAGCNRYAARRIGQKDTRVADIGAAPTDPTLSGAFYGLDESRKTNERYRRAYASCMRSRGYTN